MKAGQLRHRVELQTRVDTFDEIGQPSTSWLTTATIWADIRHLNGSEAIKAGAVTSTVSASIRIRFRNDINAGMRVLVGATVYEIRAVLPEMGKREYVDLVAELVQ